MMRVTQNMLASSNLLAISKSYERFAELNDQLTSGKKIDRPSDDPVVAIKGMFYRSNLTEVEQYKRNLSELYLWMENSESGLEQANSILQRIRELVIQGKNGTLDETDQKAVAAEIKQLKEDLVSVANTKVAGKYIFNGTKIDEQPVSLSDLPTVTNDSGEYLVEVSDGIKLKANINPANVFNTDLFTTIVNIEKRLNGDTTVPDFDQLLTDLDEGISNLSDERSELGARYNRLELIDARLGNQEIVANRVLSDNEDIDFEKVIIDLKTQESIHRAALSAGARIIQPTLIDFLR